jgi:hypothetical protein
MNHLGAKARLAELHDEVRTKMRAGTITNKRLDEIEHEAEQLNAVLATHKKATSMSDYASPYPSGDPADNPYAFPKTKMLGVGSAPRVAPLSPLQLDDAQIDMLWAAAKNQTPFRCEVGHKGLEHSGFMSDVRMKAPTAA